MSGPTGRESENGSQNDQHTEQIEYLLYQSTQGHHFMFDHSEVAQVLSRDSDPEGLNIKYMEKVQKLLTGLLEKPTMGEKRSFLDALPREDYELLVRAYFQLVDKTILAHSTIRH